MCLPYKRRSKSCMSFSRLFLFTCFRNKALLLYGISIDLLNNPYILCRLNLDVATDFLILYRGSHPHPSTLPVKIFLYNNNTVLVSLLFSLFNSFIYQWFGYVFANCGNFHPDKKKHHHYDCQTDVGINIIFRCHSLYLHLSIIIL